MTTTRTPATRSLLLALFPALLLHAPAARATPAEPVAARRGAKAYGRYCISCHGVRGDGRGPAADSHDPRPRNFVGGTYKFRSTPAAELPTDGDILRSIERGLNHTSMPHWQGITPLERRDLVQYLKSLSPRFAAEEQGKPIDIPAKPDFTPALAEKGREAWTKAQCAGCHGEGGKGDGPSATTLRDEWGTPVLPRDFTSGPLKVGEDPVDLYRAFMAGIAGSPMPSYIDTLSPEEAWALVAYVRTMRQD